ncbi:MAG: hypothetical protein ACOC2U_05260, partial [bacterium]
MIIVDIMLIVLLPLVLFILFFDKRNKMVFEFRIKILKEVSEKATEATEDNEFKDWKKYYDWFDSLQSYNCMF